MADSKPASSFVTEVEEVLMCQICWNPLVTRHPRTLQCLHTFCTPCLEEIVSKTSGNASAMSCPTCRKITELPQGKVINLPLNFAIEQMNDMLRSLDKVQSCNSCWAKGNFIHADVKCLTCDRRFCERCCGTHDGIPGFQSHPRKTIVRKKMGEKEKSDDCPKHGSEYLRFCSKCKLLLCVDCLMSGEHNNHQDSLADITRTADDVRSSLSRTQDELKIKISESKVKLEMYVKREDEFQKVKQEITQRAEGMKRTIDSQRDQLLQELQEYCFKVSQERIALVTDICDKSHDLYETIEQCADKGECEIIQFKNYMEEKITELKMEETELESGKEPPRPLYNMDSEPKMGNIVFESNQNISMPKFLNEDVTYDLQVTKAKFVSEFRDSNINIYFGFGALSNGRAVVVSSDGKRLLLYDSQARCLSTFTTSKNITKVSAYGDRILFGDCKRNCMYEVCVSKNNKLTISREYKIPCSDSYLTFDSSGNILVTSAEGESDLRKYSPEGRCLWRKYIKAGRWYIRVAVLSHRNRDMYIPAHVSPPGVKIWNEDGKQENSLDIAAGKNGPGIRGVTGSPAGTILVADCDNHTISEYGMDGSFMRHVITEDNGIRCPWDISCDSTGFLWITQSGGELVVFKLQ